MLVLSRRPQQSLLIGHDVVITVLEVNGDTVRIGISAPPEVQIHREEVYRDLQRSNREAAASPSGAADFSRQLKPRRPEETADSPQTDVPEQSDGSHGTDAPGPRGAADSGSAESTSADGPANP